ncbi:imidazole glycerol phosphate synthase subunit HisH [Aquibacillus koreensis]|uniref:Imidazole glycerol phosphate synthase subunit HisH n=1 Tax=Aquibacillus koreensis TaxID=279446 RepID=A0A9X4AKD5_9BACI|nr:imidazole glycerol phosphate synthase subunit HisH [Aquibacillus koreensis]MCT2536366.1 imidazole glycerol phosphate synthase subunit HisH [Aquibacillus koreensis]MDC3421283.1 imidazole glycerol phosphate synthase subunit HisH [Aquibacillus koreensis]
MIAIVDYGMGNVASVSTAFKRLGYEVVLTDNVGELEKASHIILPGVGSFQAAVKEISERGLKEPLQRLAKEKPFLGICLGMQLLFTEGYEGGTSQGLNLIPGTVEKIKTPYLLPHIGWNGLHIQPGHPAFDPFQDKHVYFVHSFEARTEKEYLVASTEYGSDIPAIVQKDKVYGIQFHPEKSGEVGVGILKAFLQEVK